ncbi:ABC transporter substrate-binding protein [Halapricum hydrolyticum]|uniref:ABC transporter substrate-binding protein n=1 Tax=Halapricum hydrolyticum TaxID=2979991 RepID=A0AAE3IA61_9EURY|nr:ABC transporter substrate-binding protein [Halapricum hydrolyticum]MCU4716462.1 ABC transporter substrate-binding protein [Halapricum hydrolyticum]MCU4725934.1 ABC transporter substrate-binding protein [Halapricum hydrolyticum]
MSNTDSRYAGSRSGAELLHRMVGGDGEAAMSALLEGFQSRHPGVSLGDVTDENLSLTVKSRILKENPPDVWVEWPGKNLAPYVEAGVLADVSDVWTDAAMEREYLDGPRSAATFEGTYHAVPLNIHRINNLFYNVELAVEAGVDPSSVSSPREFVELLRQVEVETGQVGMLLPMKNPWTVLQLWETVLLGEHGHDVYQSVTDGEAGRHRRAIEDALDIVSAYADLATDDALYVSLTDANERFIEGESVFFHQGDWAAGAYTETDGFRYGSNWDHVPFPGTEGRYAMNMDAVIASEATDNDEAVEAFLRYAGSADGQRRFNQKKGSIPPRTDVAMGQFTGFLQRQHEDFESSRSQPLSITHGLGVRPEQLIELKTAIASFVAERDVDAAASEMVAAFEQQ